MVRTSPLGSASTDGPSESSGDLPDEREWQNMLAALTTYKEIYGDLLIPSVFVVPHQEPWPEGCYGLRLGGRVGSIRHLGRFVDTTGVDGNAVGSQRKEILTGMGFIWRVRSERDKAEARANKTPDFVAKTSTKV